MDGQLGGRRIAVAVGCGLEDDFALIARDHAPPIRRHGARVVWHLRSALAGEGRDHRSRLIASFMERFGDADEPISAVADIEATLDERLGDPDDGDPAYKMARAVTERLIGPDAYAALDLTFLTDHITGFTLAALGLAPPLDRAGVPSTPAAECRTR